MFHADDPVKNGSFSLSSVAANLAGGTWASGLL